jgi:ATP-dependent HslUV protease ATP-binding subunit HslU
MSGMMESSKQDGLTPQQVVAELDRYIVGQAKAKRAMAVALRNRYRRQQLPAEVREEISPKNILLIGPTGVGKTEIARRLAKLTNAPFIKVEATKFTEVGYVGRDVESIVRDLLENALSMTHDEKMAEVRPKAEDLATEKIISLLCTTPPERANEDLAGALGEAGDVLREEGVPTVGSGGAVVELTKARAAKGRGEAAKARRRRKSVAKMLADRKLEEQIIEIELESEDSFVPALEFSTGASVEEIGDAFQEFLAQLPGMRKRSRQVPVREARRLLIQEEANKLIDYDQLVEEATARVEQSGIVFIDEIDKIAGRGSESGPDVSREGVQRDLLPIVEGSTVSTRYGPVKTDHILFVSAGAFHRVKPSDLIPELQGRFPIRVELESLGEDDFVRILVEPQNALSRQYQALLKMEGVTLEFAPDGVREMARIAREMNQRLENIGARRLTTIMERVLDDLSFSASDYSGQTVTVDAAYVRSRLADAVASDELSRYIL